MKRKIKFYKWDCGIKSPERATSGSKGIDMSASMDYEINSKSYEVIDLNGVLEYPREYVALLIPRSSLYRKGLIVPNSIGVIDDDYNGPQDRVGLAVYNKTPATVHIYRGDRVAQLVFCRWDDLPIEILPLSGNNNKTRDGWGSTGR